MDRKAHYAITADIIRDFCRDAIASGELPTDEQIESLIWRYIVEDPDGILDGGGVEIG